MVKPRQKPKRRPPWWTPKHRPPKAKAPGHAWPRKTVPKAWVSSPAWWYDKGDREWYEVQVAYWLLPDEVKPSTDVKIEVLKGKRPGVGGTLYHYDVPVRELRTSKKMAAPVRFFVSEEPTESRSDFERARHELEEILRTEGGEIVDEHYEGPEYGAGIDAYFVVEVPADRSTAVKKAVARTLRVDNPDLERLKNSLMPPGTPSLDPRLSVGTHVELGLPLSQRLTVYEVGPDRRRVLLMEDPELEEGFPFAFVAEGELWRAEDGGPAVTMTVVESRAYYEDE